MLMQTQCKVGSEIRMQSKSFPDSMQGIFVAVFDRSYCTGFLVLVLDGLCVSFMQLSNPVLVSKIGNRLPRF